MAELTSEPCLLSCMDVNVLKCSTSGTFWSTYNSKFYDILPNIEKNCAILFNGYDILNAKYILVALIIAFSIIE